MMDNFYVKGIVYDTMVHCFFNLTFLDNEHKDTHILDGLGFLPISKSEDGDNVNIYRIKGTKNKVVKIRFNRSNFDSIEEYRNYIVNILAEHNRSLNDLVLVKKIVDDELYNKICRMAKTREHIKLLGVYGWR